MARKDALAPYKAKRNFDITPEPADGGESSGEGLQFVIHKHWASRLHYDLRLELDGTMKSWAVPKGPSLDPHDKRMAVQVEDHPIAYNSFEGEIPARQYGAGKVILWDSGTWVPVGDARKGYRDGKLKFELRGHKLQGHWALVRIKAKEGDSARQPPWLLIKEHDAQERSSAEYSVVDALPDSVNRLPARGKKQEQAPRQADEPALVGALPAVLPAALKPQLATLVDAPPTDANDWLYEIKFDGYRLLARIDKRSVTLFTRNGHDWTHKLPQLADQLHDAQLPPCWLDGEIVVNGAAGVPDFQALQNAFDRGHTQDIVYYVFDLPFCDGLDLRQVVLEERRHVLQWLFGGIEGDAVRFSEPFDAPGKDMVLSACKLGLEGVIGKRRSSPYRSSRSPDWIKLKCSQRQEFVIVGWTDPQGARQGFGALLLAVHDERGALRYAGKVGTGFSALSLVDLGKKLDALATTDSALAAKTVRVGKVHWVVPNLIAEISFSEWTASGSVRHPVFHGLRADKPATAIVRERPAASRANASVRGLVDGQPISSAVPKSLRVSSPDRLVDPKSGATKLDIVTHYAQVAPLILPHLKGRPVSLMRAPGGLAGELFFQKHLDNRKMPGVRELDRAIDPYHAQYLEIATRQGLLSAAQMNVVEFHTWNAVKASIYRPDRMTFDLDPGDGVPWSRVQQAAQLVRVLLDELELVSFLKTSGGKGLHVVVPLRKQYDWDTVKAFSKDVVRHLADTLPHIFVAKSGPRNRVGKIFADYLRNGFGATTACAWTLRARPGLGVSVPIGWSELEEIGSGAHWTLANIGERLQVGNTPWDGYAYSARSAREAMAALGFEPNA